MDKKWTALVPSKQIRSKKTGRPLQSYTAPKTIGSLPEDAYLLLFYYLPVPDTANLARCCRKVAALAKDERVWTRKLNDLDWKGPYPEDATEALKARDRRRSSSILSSSTSASAADRSASATNLNNATSSQTTKAPRRTSLLQQSHVNNLLKSPAIPEDDVFGSFVDSNQSVGHPPSNTNSPQPPNLADGFASIDLMASEPPSLFDSPLQPTKDLPPPSTKRKEEDLLMLFDDEDLDDIGQATASPVKPKTRPPSQSFSSLANGAHKNSAPSPHVRVGSPSPSYDLFAILYKTLLPYFVSLQSHSTSSLVFTRQSFTPTTRAQLLSTLKNLLKPNLAPTRSATTLQVVRRNLLSSIDFFESSQLQKFEKAVDHNVINEMKELVSVCWELNKGVSVIQVFINKIELFYQSTPDPLRNLTKVEDPSGYMVDGIDFTAMDGFMNQVLKVVQKEGFVIARIFPPNTDVLVYFAERIIVDVVGDTLLDPGERVLDANINIQISDYINSLLEAAQDLPNPLFLLTTAAAFAQSSRITETILDIRPASTKVTKERLDEHIYKMFEPHMKAYLIEEGKWARELLESICKEWDEKLAQEQESSDPTFLASQNPQQVKKNVLAGFTKALLLPVTIVPKTVAFSVNAITYGGAMAFNAVGLGGLSTPVSTLDDTTARRPYEKHSRDGGSKSSLPITPLAASSSARDFGSGFHMLVSIDTAMQLIQANRDCLKRIQTFGGYTGFYAKKIKEAIEEVFSVLCQTLAVYHVVPAFVKATNQMGLYKPADHEVDESVMPLVQFFELVHVGDTIAQMVQVYYDKELTRYVDKNDFLSVVVREKKKFENQLDEAVASGLNAGVQILMTQADYILQTQQDPRDFSPDDLPKAAGGSVVLDIEGPTSAAVAVVACLKSHCNMLKGSTDKAILEVFHQEVALRLHGILLKHFKKSIVSIPGGFQIIADLNLYASFVASLKVPNVMPYFTALKMVANVFVIDSPRDLGLMARDLDRYEGTLRIEDIMELVHCRTDWKRIEREVEKEVFGFKAEDCVVQ